MSLISLKITNFFGWLFIIFINYFIILFLIYVLSVILLFNRITPDIKLIQEYQRNFYSLGMRNIWQSQHECVKFSKNQIYSPKEGSCSFDNIEFKTTVSFDKLGRTSDHPKNQNGNGVAVLGDSFAMGWGVNDNETFSYLLEKKINRPIYNLAVSGYGTVRELLRLKEANLLDKIDTIIIQYCYNDYGENVGYSKTSLDETKEKYKIIVEGSEYSSWKKLRKSFRYSSTIAKNVFMKKDNSQNFNHHIDVFIDVLKNFPFIQNKKIIVFYVNGYQSEFINFPSGKSKILDNLEYFDLDIERDKNNFYLIDGHLNPIGHKQIAEKLSQLL